MPDHTDGTAERPPTDDAPPDEASRPEHPALPSEPPRRVGGIKVGYRADEVDAFLSQLLPALDRTPPAMAPYEVADARFKASHVRRRYDMRSVDDYLARVQEVLRERHGGDAVADVEGHESPPRHVRTAWIYAIALVLVVVMLAFAVTQL